MHYSGRKSDLISPGSNRYKCYFATKISNCVTFTLTLDGPEN